jgi:hypothetical protein
MAASFHNVYSNARPPFDVEDGKALLLLQPEDETEKGDLLILEPSQLMREGTNTALEQQPPRKSFALAPLTCVGICGVLLWFVSGCFVSSGLKETNIPPADSFSLIKRAVQVAIAAPTSAVLECFQVYQPVLFPSGAVDETILSDGAENTTTIDSTDSTSSCQVLLMEHSFGFSYGIPFVGKLPSLLQILTSSRFDI